MSKTIEQLHKEKRIMEQSINGAITLFRDQNPDIELNFQITKETYNNLGEEKYYILEINAVITL